MDQSSHPDDVALLRTTFPQWEFEEHWITSNSGPDQRFLMARKGDQTLSAWTANDLAALVTAAQISEALRDEERPR